MSSPNNRKAMKDNVKDTKDLMMKIKNLNEEIIELKLTSREEKAKMTNVKDLASIRSEIKKADMFITAIMKDSLCSYMELTAIEENFIIKKERKFKDISSEAMSNRLKMDNCNCSTCNLNKSLRDTIMSYKTNEKISGKEFMLTRNLFLKVHYNSDTLSFINDSRKMDHKTITLMNRKTRNMDCTFEIYRKTDNEELMAGFNFSTNLNMEVPISILSKVFKVSFSAIMVVKAMREMESEVFKPCLNSTPNESCTDVSCFSEMVKHMLGITNTYRDMYKVSDLTEDEEVILLSHSKDIDVYIYIQDGEANNKKNHISLKPFDGSTMMKLNMMVTPMFRNVMFFMRNTDNREILEEFQLDLSNLSESSGIMADNSNSLRSNNKFKIDKMEALIFDRAEPNDFIMKWFLGKNKDKGYSEDRLKNLLDSPNVLWQFKSNSEYIKPAHIHLSMMPYRSFAAIAFFTADKKEFVNMVLNKDINDMRQCESMLQKIVYEKVLLECSEEMAEVGFVAMYNKVLDNICNMAHMSSPWMLKMYSMFKLRVTSYMIMVAKAHQEESDLAETHSSVLLSQDLFKESMHKFLLFKQMALKSDVYKNSKESIINWQPDKKTVAFLKDKETKEMSMKIQSMDSMLFEGFEMIDEYHDMVSKINKI